MLKNTFIHIPRVGEKTERKLWEQNYTDWDTIITSQTVDALGPSTAARVKEFAEKSKRALTRNDGAYFQALLNSQHTWRGYKEFAANTAYVDIETTGLSKYTSVVTMIAVHNTVSGTKLFIRGQNLDEFNAHIEQYPHIVTFNGAQFDLPFMEHCLNSEFHALHTDLRYPLAQLGFTGGLKQIEKDLNITRDEADGLTGKDAVRLWHKYESGDRDALETLKAYCEADTQNLEDLYQHVYYEKRKEYPV